MWRTNLIGFVVLAHARTPVEVNWEVSDLLKTASRQAAGFLAQMHATEALLEARKFDAFNRMSAFVVHDLKNIVTQLSLMLKNAKRLHANPEFQQDMLATVENSLEKMRQLMLQLREGEAHQQPARSGVDLMPIARRIEARRRAARPRDRGADDRRARGHARPRSSASSGSSATSSRTRSTPPRPPIGSGSRWRARSGQAEVEVGDTGMGMSQEFVQTRLFKPFRRTKEAGMGIGAYESFQYIRELGGSIDVDSESTAEP